ncbi:rhodanese-like domain-containing protein [Flammeovirga yaeyamensis]|uniref:Rhodanese-like domain-containing protein n=1 Tax=Flammeovirga yaeyamensis TaxID=367791 RepID=A0AAX1N3L9_9BACT|nr:MULTISPECIES: rhodanese-like domain-containing protein [Flammeovirga]ANQ47615.1 rhodanese-like domain-containing protein [Flammeovirga sp. MY04]MBB3698658.1 adenylyltransferase/sulfurtransferase [Flammeovirga yaeyamensis]NMF33997.1 rhodanese-like domain-containing protein [Flammeovirga yaeyamensis]QWG00986.1 rhodanese-like domain-containing protein [Flammeovirga yaeyamensis]
MKSITVQELRELQESGADFQLIDVREDYEFDEANLGGELIPLATVIDEADKISKDKRVIVHCRSGKRSANAIEALEGMKGYTNLENLEGGILAYIDEFGLED